MLPRGEQQDKVCWKCRGSGGLRDPTTLGWFWSLTVGYVDPTSPVESLGLVVGHVIPPFWERTNLGERLLRLRCRILGSWSLKMLGRTMSGEVIAGGALIGRY